MKLLTLLLFVPLLSFSQFSANEVQRFGAQAQRVTIFRDQWGVPHIYGKTDADAVFGLLYAQCEDNFRQVEENYIEMLGRTSEIRGKEQLYNDLQMQLIYDTAAAVADYRKSPAWLRKLLDAAADGINFYLYRHPEVQPALLKKFEPWYALLRTDGSIGATQTGGLTLQDMKNLYPAEGKSTSYLFKLQPEPEPAGSNGFAAGPSRTASGNAILYINPHTTFFFRPEVHIVSDEGLNAYGAVTWGTFFIYQGFNEHCGWMHTSSYADVADLFTEQTVRNEKGLFYRYNGKTLPVKTKQVTLRYKDAETSGQQTFTTYATLHGPVMGSRNGEWLSLKEKNRSMEALMQSWLRTKARGFGEFRKVMDMRVNNSNNTVFADSRGNIAYWHGNFMPKRNPGYDYSRPVDGTVSATNWKGVHALKEVVHIYNPATGWIQNCNSTPFTAAGESSPKKEDYPPYMAPDGENYRGILAARLLDTARGITIEKMINDIGYNRYLAALESLLPALFLAYSNTEASSPLSGKLKEAVALLEAWNMHAADSSIATAIAIEWAYRIMSAAPPLRHPYDNSNFVKQVETAVAATTPVAKLTLLAETLDDLETRFGTWKVTWGEVNRYQRPPDGKFSDAVFSLPVGLGPGIFGSLPSFAARRFAGTNRRYGVSGNSFVACVEFGSRIKARSVITGGQGFDPRSPHFSDQALMYIEGDFKDVLFYKEDVLRHADSTYHPGETWPGL